MNILESEKIIYHADRLWEIKKTNDTYPVHLSLGVVDFCNHRCVFCNTDFATADTSRQHIIDRKRIVMFLKEMVAYGLKAVTICGSGEPLIYPEIIPLLYDIKEMGLDIGIFTNGYKLDKDVRKAILDTCTFVRCSINASNSYEHESVHQVKNQFEKIVANVKALVNEKNRNNQILPTIGTQFVFYEDNYKSIIDATKLWKDVGVDYFEIKPLIEGEGSNVGKTVFSAKDKETILDLMRETKKFETSMYRVYTKYDQYITTISKNTRTYKRCYGHALEPNIWSDGNMFLCPNHEHTADIIGNIYENSFIDIWKGEKRKKRVSEIEVLKCPRGCRCDKINERIWDYLYPNKVIHPNFI